MMQSSDQVSFCSEKSQCFQRHHLSLEDNKIQISNCQQQQQSWRKRRLKTFEQLKINSQISQETISEDKIQFPCAKEQLFTSYTKIKQIGMGYQSICYKVQDKQTNVFFVAKIARCTENDEEFLLSLKQEYALLKELNHPNIIQIYESFESENEFIQLIEFVKAQSLESKLCTKQFQEQEIVQIGCKLLKTIEYIHKKGIMHRDINLSNVLYSRKKNIFKLLDFGVAKCQLNQTIFNLSSAGNKKFQAPEMFSCKSYSCKIDIWGVGLILYSLLHSNIIGTKSLMKTKFQLNFLETSQPFQQLLIQLLEKNQEKRISASDALELEIFKQQF